MKKKTLKKTVGGSQAAVAHGNTQANQRFVKIFFLQYFFYIIFFSHFC